MAFHRLSHFWFCYRLSSPRLVFHRFSPSRLPYELLLLGRPWLLLYVKKLLEKWLNRIGYSILFRLHQSCLVLLQMWRLPEKFWLPTVCTYQIHAVRWDIRFNLRNILTYLETSQILLVILKLIIIHTVSHITRCDGDVCNVMLRSSMLELEWNCSTIVLYTLMYSSLSRLKRK